MLIFLVSVSPKIRALWHHYFKDTDALIFVVDSNDPERLQEAQEELYSIMGDDRMRGAALLVFCNKQDLPRSLGPAQVMEKLELTKRFHGTDYLCQGCVGTTGDGLYEGLDWLASTLNKRPKKQSNLPPGYS